MGDGCAIGGYDGVRRGSKMKKRIGDRERKRRKEQSWRDKGGVYLHTPEGPVSATPSKKGWELR